MNVAVIPARGGSKRIPRKNIKDFCGKPIIAWSIEAALESQLFEKVIVSTDCPEISKVAQSYGAEVPFLRPDELSDDHTPTLPVLGHAIEELEAAGSCEIDHLCCLYATAPFVTSAKLIEGYFLLEKNLATEVVFTITHFPFPIQRALHLSEGRLEMREPEHELTRSQDLEEHYHDAGQFYFLRRNVPFSGRGLYSSNARGLLLPPEQVQDIDTLEDWSRAEKMFKLQN